MLVPETAVQDARIRRARLDLALCVDETLQLRGIDVPACEAVRTQLAQATFNLVVAGQFNRGKSTLINALLGEDILPMGVIPLTSIVTVVRHGPGRCAHIELQDGRTRLISLRELESFVTERGNPGNTLNIRQVVIDHPSPWLSRGLRLIDTPGIGSVHGHNTEQTTRFLPQADAVLFIASADQPMTRAELDFLGGIRQYADKVICVLNKIDHLSADELRQAGSFACEQLRTCLQADVPVFAVSARAALDSHLRRDPSLYRDSRFDGLERELNRFLAQERETTWEQSLCRRLLAILSRLRFALELEDRLIRSSQEEVNQKLGLFRARSREVRLDMESLQTLLESDAGKLLAQQIDPAVAGLQSAIEQSLLQAIPSWRAELPAVSARGLRNALEDRMADRVRAVCEDWIRFHDVQFRLDFDHLCRRAWDTLQATMDDLMRYSSELFRVEACAVHCEAQWSPAAPPLHRPWQQTSGLSILISSVALSLPRPLSMRFVLRWARARAVQLSAVHAAQVGNDIAGRIRSSVSDACRRITASSGAIASSIDAAIDNAAAARARNAEVAQARALELADELAGVSAIEHRVRDLLH